MSRDAEVILAFYEPTQLAGQWRAQFAFDPASDLAVTKILSPIEEEGERSHEISSAGYLALTPRYLGKEFSNPLAAAVTVVVHAVDQERFGALKGASGQSALQCGALGASLGLGAVHPLPKSPSIERPSR